MTPRNTHFDNNNDGGKDDDGDGNDDDGNDDDGKTKLTAASFCWVINNFSFFSSSSEKHGERIKST